MGTRIEFFERELTLALDSQIGPEAMARRLAEFSRHKLAEVIGTGAGTRNYTRFVNGREGAREEAVKAPGDILYVFNWWPEILVDAMAYLRTRSPGSRAGGHKGRKPYRDSWFVMADGREVNTRQYKDIPPGSVVTITNDAPYSQLLDLQLRGGRSVNVSVPPGIVEDAAEVVRSKWGALIKAERVYTVGFSGQYVLRKEPRGGKPVHSPALVLTPRR
jgi:hypothetical protein